MNRIIMEGSYSKFTFYILSYIYNDYYNIYCVAYYF